MTGCATPPPDPGVWVSSPTGTVFTYLRRTTGSYGTGEFQVVWTVGAERTWEGRRVVPNVSPQAGTTLYDAVGDGLVAQLSTAGQPVFSFDPPIALQLPLAVGKTWSSKHTMTLYAQQAKVPVEVAFKVEALEDVAVPAGTYKAFRVVMIDSFGEVDTRWWVPSQGGLLVKRVADRPAKHPQGAGRLEGQLLSTTAPK
jgi:hypothetical protein